MSLLTEKQHELLDMVCGNPAIYQHIKQRHKVLSITAMTDEQCQQELDDATNGYQVRD